MSWNDAQRDRFIAAARDCGARTSQYDGRDWLVYMPGGRPAIVFEERSHRVHSSGVDPQWLDDGPVQWWRVLLGAYPS